ncbi:unnamed protein product [Protopolystoma xenopodis]|uniref:Uncharacterized protein n=1 Tax=Protopolystoma xenopodis TaxID=117903 RepID=A0A448WS36_9PLAT|nr:unnamed protein product [Protopolystoma xenopodis]
MALDNLSAGQSVPSGSSPASTWTTGSSVASPSNPAALRLTRLLSASARGASAANRKSSAVTALHLAKLRGGLLTAAVSRRGRGRGGNTSHSGRLSGPELSDTEVGDLATEVGDEIMHHASATENGVENVGCEGLRRRASQTEQSLRRPMHEDFCYRYLQPYFSKKTDLKIYSFLESEEYKLISDTISGYFERSWSAF